MMTNRNRRSAAVCVYLAIGGVLALEVHPNATIVDVLFLRGKDYIRNETAIAIELAEERLRAEQILPPWIQFNIMDVGTCSGSGEAQAFEPMLAASEVYYSRPVDVIIGPQCSPGMRYTARLAKNWNLPIVSYLSVSAEFADRSMYPTLSRVSITLSSLSAASVTLLKHLNVTRVGVVKDPNNPIDMWIYKGVLDALVKSGIKINVDVDVTLNQNGMEVEALHMLRDNARIIVVAMNYWPETAFMELLATNGMATDEFLYIVPSGPGLLLDEYVTSDLAALAFSRALVIHAEGIDFETVSAFHKRMENEKNVTFGNDGLNDLQQLFRNYYPVVHDTFYFYMMIAAQLITNNRTDILSNGLEFWKHLPNRNFIGASGHVWMDEAAERLPNYVVDMVDAAKIRRIFSLNIGPVCGAQICDEIDGQIVGKITYEWFPKLLWPYHKAFPPEVPECGFRGEICDKTHIYIIGLCAAFTLVLILGVRRMHSTWEESKLYKMEWRIHSQQLIAASKAALNSSSTMKIEEHSNVSGAQNKIIVGRELCALTLYHQEKGILFSRAQLAMLNQLKHMKHENLSSFVGLCFDSSDKDFKILWTMGSRSLQTLVYDMDVQLDKMFQASFIRDIIRGLEYIHASPIGCHGCLNITNTYATSHWEVKLSGFGLQPMLLELNDKGIIKYDRNTFLELVHVAPELLREGQSLDTPTRGSQKGDIYSLGMVIYQILYRTPPYMDPLALVQRIVNELDYETDKPEIPFNSVIVSKNLLDLKACWSCEPNRRPKLATLKVIAAALSPNHNGLVDNMIKMMEKYAENLERLVRDRTLLLEEAQKQADILLFQLLPQSVAVDLKAGKHIEPTLFSSATVSFTDIVGFTPICSQSSPLQIVSFLNDLFSRFDEVIAAHDAYKVETIGDAYLIVSGLPQRNEHRHAHEICSIALGMRKCAELFKMAHLETKVEIRIGVDSGAVAAGVIGLTTPRYCIFGDTVNTASRMETSGEPMKIQVTEATQLLLDGNEQFSCNQRGTITVKGKGQLLTYWLDRA